MKLFWVEIPRELIDRVTKEVYLEIKKVAKIPGFRPGSAPQDLLEKHYSEDAKGQILQRLVPVGYREALKTHKIMPAGLPRVFNINFEDGKPLTFEAEVDCRPDVRLKSYKGIKVSKKRIFVASEEVEEAISRLRNMYAEYENLPGPVKRGDYAVCDVEAFIDGKPITKKNKNMWIQAEKEASLLGMGEKLVGTAKGESKEIETKLPDNYPDKKYAGKPAKFKIVVNEIKEKKPRALDESLAMELKAESVEALKKEIESGLYKRKENNLKIQMQTQILDRLLADNKFSVPEGMVKRQKEVLAKRLEMELMQKGLQKEEAAKKVKELDSQLDKDAAVKVRLYFILDDIAMKEKIEVNDKDVGERIKLVSMSTGQPEEEVKKYYEKENLTGGLREEIKETKALELLLKQASITEEKEGV